jgi:uncharacterized protein with NRDE domain
MCVLAFAWRAHPRWRLVVAGNRDELHARPAAPIARWDEPAGILAGRDLQSGGTWLGVSEHGRFAVVTNLRGHGGNVPDKRSRGALVTGMLTGTDGDPDAGDLDPTRFNPFNLIVADAREAVFQSNEPQHIRCVLAPGIYGLSNGALDEPWPKTMLLKSRMLDWIVRGDARPERLLDDLREDVLPDVGIRSSLPSDVPEEPRHSPIFIRHPVYGTRCSTVVAIDEHGHGAIIERRYTPDGEMEGETTLRFTWPE